jgi:hypothetical protein
MAADRRSDRPSNKNAESVAEAVANAAPGEGERPSSERRQVTVNGQTFTDRRGQDAGSPTGLERRRGPGRRLSDFSRAAEEGELTPEQFLFLMAIEGFKKANNKVYPSWTDVLEVVRLLGYRKTMPSEINLRAAEDWQEPADAPAEVRPKRRDAA